MARPSWDEYFMSLAHLVASRSTCLRRSVGAILVRDRRILATGYNGAPMNVKHCEEVGCIREAQGIPSGMRHEFCRGLHAEQNVIIQAAYHGIVIKDSVLYTTNKPCIICAKMLISAGVLKIIYREGYDDALTDPLLDEAKIKIEQFKGNLIKNVENFRIHA